MGFNPDEYLAKKSAGFDPDKYLASKTPTPDDPGILPTIVDKVAQGGTAGFAPAFSGGLEALGQAAGVQGLGGKFKDMHLSDQGPTTDWDVIKHAYINGRDKDKKSLKQESEDHPLISGASEMAGAVMSPLNQLAGGGGSAIAGGIIGGVQGAGNSDSDSYLGQAKDALVGAGMGAGIGYAGDKILSPLVGKAAGAISRGAGGAAEKFAENATGATGKQASKFEPDAGRQLLDRGLVKFGDSPANVADRVSGAVDKAGAQIDNSLGALDAKGATASADNVVSDLQSQIAALKKDPSKAGLVKKLQSTINDIIDAGSSNVPLSEAEATKRGFRKAAGNWMDPDAGQAGKTAYLSYMNEVEGAANAADPALAQQFQEGKKTFGLLAPIQEAAERRASTLNQSPLGGLGDMAAAATGGGMLGPLGAVGGVIGKKVLAPRLASSSAVTLDAISKALQKSPQMANLAQSNPAAFQALAQKLEGAAGVNQNSIEQMLPRAADNQDDQASSFNGAQGKDAILSRAQGSKYSQVLQQAAQKGDQSLAAAHFVLSSRDPDYRKQIEGN